MGGKKVVFLFLALLLPIGVFIFLKIFGKNEFEVPLLYHEGVEKSEECNLDYAKPYLIPDSIYRRLDPEQTASLVVLNFENASTDLEKLTAKFAKENVLLIQLQDSKTFSHYDIGFLKSCIFLTEAPQTLVLVDHLKRIRGQYDGTDRDEIDRLDAEIKIILKKY